MTYNTFDRGDYKYLYELAFLFFGEESMQLHCHQPRAHHEARFLVDCNYLLVIYKNQDILKHYDNMHSLVKDALILHVFMLKCFSKAR